VGFS